MMKSCVSTLLALSLLACAGPGPVGSDEANKGITDDSNPLGSAPQNLETEPGDGAIIVTWEMPPEIAVDGFNVYYRKMLPGPPWDGNGALNGDAPIWISNATEITLAGLKNGTTYYVAVAATNGNEEGPLSASTKATPEREVGAQRLIPAGVFTMGASPAINAYDEEPAHPVYLDAFWMDKYVSTNEDYRACVDAEACAPPRALSGYLTGITLVEDYFEDPLLGDFPVVYLEYENAVDYCAWRDMRLPTEAEWEKAARGDQGQIYPWGDSTPTCDMANFNDDGIFCEGGTVPVGTYASNISPFGILEMGGNVWQWTSDWYADDAYENSTCLNPTGPETGIEKVLRGGAWYYDQDALTVTYRNRWAPTFTFFGSVFGDYRGFGVRCVRNAVGVPCDPETVVCDLPDSCDPDGEQVVDQDAGSTDTGTPDLFEEDLYEPDESEPDTDDPVDLVEADQDSDENEDGVDDPDIIEEDTEDSEDTIEPPPDLELPCENPQDEYPDITLCYDTPPPVCPSGWLGGCEEKSCACAIGISTDPGTCGDETMTVQAGWRDVYKVFYPFQEDEPMEICEGFQGGVHVAVVFKADAPNMLGDYFYADIYALMKIGSTVVGSFTKETTKVSRSEDGLFTSKLQQIRFEGCVGTYYAGHDATIEVLIRDKDDNWGTTTFTIPLVDEVDGPFLDPAQNNPC